ncbi:MAG: hypothetical protein AAFP76_09420 [Bacteroidota bacterium]
MAKIKFKCKEELANGKKCGKPLSTKLYPALPGSTSAKGAGTPRTISDQVFNANEGVPDIPADWEFNLICSDDHENDYSYDEREQ